MKRNRRLWITLMGAAALLAICIVGMYFLWFRDDAAPTFAQESYTAQKGKPLQLSVQYSGKQKLIYDSSDENILKVDNDGNVTVIKGGAAIVSVATENGKHSATVSVDCVVPCTSITVDQPFELTVGQKKKITATVLPEDTTDPALSWKSSDEGIATVAEDGTVTAVAPGNVVIVVSNTASGNTAETNVTVKAKKTTTPTPTPTPPSFAGSSVTGVTYIQGIAIANKTYALPADYAPGITAETSEAFQQMKAAAAADGINLWIKSGYRSYASQKSIYNNYVNRDGQAAADTYSARPGHSEHQLGLALDLNSLDTSWGDTAEGKWLAANCHRFGFIIRYPADKTAITGYMYEPWHVRYLGVDTATAVKNSGLCLEEYLGITSRYQ